MKLQLIIISLILLLILLFGCYAPVQQLPNSKDIIGNTLSMAKEGASITTQSFFMEKGEIISNQNFEEKGFDNHSILFYQGKTPTYLLDVSANESSFYATYLGQTTAVFKAKVICQTTGSKLSKTLDDFNIKKEVEPTAVCGEEDYQPCCVVIFERDSGSTYTPPSTDYESILIAGIIGIIVLGAIIGFFATKKNPKKIMRVLITIGIIVILFFFGFAILSMLTITVAKPAIYLYPRENSQINVNLQLNGFFTQTIPEYGNGWNVFVEEDGLIEGQYDYLFYEMKLFQNNFVLPNEGWVVSKESLVQWFDKKLIEFGLNEKEKDQFEEYWLPKLMETNSNYYEIKLLSKEFLASNLKLNITPKPDSELRLIFSFKPIEKAIEIIEPKITPFERKGFVAVEWGGLIIN